LTVSLGMLPYLKLSPRTLLIDDCDSFIDAMTDILPARLSPRLVLHPADVDAQLADQARLLRAEQVFFSGLDAAAEGPGLLRAVEYLRWEERRRIYSVLVSDHAMPAETGARLCGRHKYVGLRRILLTGAADSDLAVTAFNAGAIEQFLPKQSRKLYEVLVSSIEDQSRKSSEDRSVRLTQSMPDAARRLFSDPAFVDGLKAFLVSCGVVEYIASVQPMGLMALSATGQTLWVQIEDEDSLSNLQEMAEDSGWMQPEVCLISSGKWLANVELVAQVEGVTPALMAGVCLCPGVFAAAFPLPDAARASAS